MLLLDEIALAEDAVLERLNSVLESGRTLLLAEKVRFFFEEVKASHNLFLNILVLSCFCF